MQSTTATDRRSLGAYNIPDNTGVEQHYFIFHQLKLTQLLKICFYSDETP